jgi:hypothetical protein
VSTNQPAGKEITSWFDFVSQNFIYRGVLGLGGIIGLLLDGAGGEQPVRALEIGDWPRSGLPWIAFWLKELITWGTLDPVAAFLLARGDAIDRPEAQDAAREYYANLAPNADPNDALDPRLIRDWVQARSAPAERSITVREFAIEARLERPARDYRESRMTVAPIDIDDRLSDKPFNWPETPASFNFELVVPDSTVVGEAYLRHA